MYFESVLLGFPTFKWIRDGWRVKRISPGRKPGHRRSPGQVRIRPAHQRWPGWRGNWIAPDPGSLGSWIVWRLVTKMLEGPDSVEFIQFLSEEFIHFFMPRNQPLAKVSFFCQSTCLICKNLHVSRPKDCKNESLGRNTYSSMSCQSFALTFVAVSHQGLVNKLFTVCYSTIYDFPHGQWCSAKFGVTLGLPGEDGDRTGLDSIIVVIFGT